MKTSVIIAAGGMGSRLNVEGGKQFMLLAGKPVVIHSIQFFQAHPLIHEIVIVTSPDSIARCHQFVDKFDLTKVSAIVPSGPSRQESVANGMAVIENADYILIHDGARPLMKPSYIDAILQALYDVSGAIVAIPVTDTIKTITPQGFVSGTLNRSELVAVQTPQGFRADILRLAYALPDKHLYTDDSSMVEAVGGQIKVIPGHATNLKITYSPDVLMAERLLQESLA